MELTLEQMKSVARGVARVECVDGKIGLFRFTEAQEQMYKERSKDLYMKTFATAGVILEFDTDSEQMSLSVEISRGSSRKFFVHSIFADQKRIGELAGEENVPFSGTYSLGAGMKRVKILFPWSAVSRICALVLDDGAQVIPVKKNRKVLLFGDSITQGYDAMKPENSYASKLVEWLDADGINKAIGAEIFFPELAKSPEDFVPDLITVAYGTNDWSKCTREMLERNSRAFYQNLRGNYPGVKIIALAPIWRADHELEKEAGPFAHIAEHYRQLAAEIGNMTVIDCFDFIPHSPDYFSDLRLHPNDEGFRFYAEGLIKTLSELDVKGNRITESGIAVC